MLAPLLLAAALTAAAPDAPEAPRAYALMMTGNELLRLCRGVEAEVTSCIGYIEGVADAANVARSVKNSQGFYCPGPGVDAGQMLDVVVKWLVENPARRDNNASLLVMVALRGAFPCGE